jgi:hypothetical protein
MPLAFKQVSGSILIYRAAHGVVNFESTAIFLFGGLVKYAPLLWWSVWLASAILLIQLALLYFLYEKRWF